MAQCTATSKRSGQRCNNAPVTGATTCRMHGGTAALRNRGAGNGNYKHGRHAKDFGESKLKQRYLAARNDLELLAMRDELAVLDALLGEGIAKLSSAEAEGASLKQWTRVADLVLDLEAAVATKNWPRQGELLTKLKDAVQAGRTEAETRAEVRQLIQERTKVAEREQKRLVAMRAMLTAEQAHAVFEQILDTLNEVVTDAELRRELNVRLARIAGSIGDEVA